MDKTLLDDARSRFKKTWQRLDGLFTMYAKSHGMNFTTMIILELLNDDDVTYTQTGISEKLMIPKQLINSIITSFLQQGYVELKEAHNRRTKNIFLTEKGKEYAEQIINDLDEAESKAWMCFTSDEAVAFVEAMEKYEKSFEQTLEDVPK